MLADRFGIKATKIEVKTLPVFEISLLRALGSGNQTHLAQRCRGRTAAHPPFTPPRCSPNGITIAQLAGTLTGIVHRQVIDKTSLSGTYDVDLKWTA